MPRRGFVFYCILPLLTLVGYLWAQLVFPTDRQGPLFSETGFYELGTAGFFLLAGCVAITICLQCATATLRHRAFFLVFAMAAWFVGLEELSYGQHLFGYNAPAWFEQHSTKRELNLHNLYGDGLSDVLREVANLVFPIGGIVMPLLAMSWRNSYKLDHWSHYLLPRSELTSIILIGQLLTIVDDLFREMIGVGVLARPGEVQEFYWGMAAAVYAEVLRQRLVTKPALATNPLADGPRPMAGRLAPAFVQIDDAHSSLARTRARFDTPQAAAKYVGRRLDRRMRRESRCILSALQGVARGSSVLDLPCGVGRLAPVLVDHGFRVTGADNSPHMIERASVTWRLICQERPELKGKAEFEVQDIVQTSFADEQFDAVLCNRLFHHFSEAEIRRAALAELRRVCSGPIVVFFFNSFALDSIRLSLTRTLFGKFKRDRMPILLEEISADGTAAGLQLERVVWTRWAISPQCFAVFRPTGPLLRTQPVVPRCGNSFRPDPPECSSAVPRPHSDAASRQSVRRRRCPS